MIESLGDFEWAVALLLGFVTAWVIQRYRLSMAKMPTPEELEESERERATQCMRPTAAAS